MAEVLQPDIDALMADHGKFNEFVYTPIREAVQELKNRQQNLASKEFPLVPQPLKENPFQALLFRHIASPNYEARRFLSITDAMELKPLFLEYSKDRFTTMNEAKLLLGKMCFFKGKDSTGNNRIEYKTIIDFNKANSTPINSIETLWKQNLIEFHHELLEKAFPTVPFDIFDMSDWIKQNGERAKEYYKALFEVLTTHGILFENYLIDAKEEDFTKNIVLPAFIEVMNKTGKKPMIVALEPTEIEGDHFWNCHPIEDKTVIKEKVESEKLAGAKKAISDTI